MPEKGLPRIIAGVLMAVLCSGCFRATELARMKCEVEQELPEVGFEKEVELSLGPLSLGCFRLLCLLAPNSGEARGYLGEIDRIKVAAYRTLSRPSLATFQLPTRLKNMLTDGGWELAIKAREDGEATWLFYRVHDQTIRGLYVISLDAEELVLVRLDGHLGRLVAKAVESPKSSNHKPSFAEW